MKSRPVYQDIEELTPRAELTEIEPFQDKEWEDET